MIVANVSSAMTKAIKHMFITHQVSSRFRLQNLIAKSFFILGITNCTIAARLYIGSDKC